MKSETIQNKNNKYKDELFIKKYAGLWAFGYLNGIGYSEGLYRSINELGYVCFERKDALSILDVGCGVGRTTADYANYFVNATVTAIDSAEHMITCARKIVISKDSMLFDLEDCGFQKMSIKGFGLKNVMFENISLSDYYIHNKDSKKFDLVTGVNLIDRIDNVEESFRNIYNLLKGKGVYIFSSPLNFSKAEDWNKYGSVELLRELIESIGFKIDICFDNLMYKEVLDGRGATEEYKTVVMRLIK
jgi:SAM-dependent methyltransferase